MSNPQQPTDKVTVELTAAEIHFLKTFHSRDALDVAKNLLHCACFACEEVPAESAMCIQHALCFIRYYEAGEA